jgi:transcriptional regulator with XRE-family HTH domain
MTRSIEEVVAEAQRRLEATGRLNVAAFASAYPEHAAELKEILPVMIRLHQERRWQRAERESRAFALGLFAQLTGTEAAEAAGRPGAAVPAAGGPSHGQVPVTVGELLRRDREASGVSLEEQARRLGVSVQALEELLRDGTPINRLDNAAIKQLAARAAAPFATLLKEIRRLISLESLSVARPGEVFTRDRELSSAEEQEALREQVKRKIRRPPGES